MHSSIINHRVKKRKARAGGKSEPLILVKQWIHQGFTYLDRTERMYRILWEIIPFTGLLYFFFKVMEWSGSASIALSGFIAHTLNWIFNYNFWTCITFAFAAVKNPGNDKTILYLQKLQRRMLRYECITGCMLYGSVSRKKWHDKSDLDMRILRKPGFINGFKAYLVVFCERLIAVFSMQPLDVYLADTVEFLNKMRDDEFPVFLKNKDDRLSVKYGTKTETDFNDVNSLNTITGDEDIESALGV